MNSAARGLKSGFSMNCRKRVLILLRRESMLWKGLRKKAGEGRRRGGGGRDGRGSRLW